MEQRSGLFDLIRRSLRIWIDGVHDLDRLYGRPKKSKGNLKIEIKEVTEDKNEEKK